MPRRIYPRSRVTTHRAGAVTTPKRRKLGPPIAPSRYVLKDGTTDAADFDTTVTLTGPDDEVALFWDGLEVGATYEIYETFMGGANPDPGEVGDDYNYYQQFWAEEGRRASAFEATKRTITVTADGVSEDGAELGWLASTAEEADAGFTATFGHFKARKVLT